jgi:hypothetical protein
MPFFNVEPTTWVFFSARGVSTRRHHDRVCAHHASRLRVSKPVLVREQCDSDKDIDVQGTFIQEMLEPPTRLRHTQCMPAPAVDAQMCLAHWKTAEQDTDTCMHMYAHCILTQARTHART